jgi:hypothetical protein
VSLLALLSRASPAQHRHMSMACMADCFGPTGHPIRNISAVLLVGQMQMSMLKVLKKMSTLKIRAYCCNARMFLYAYDVSCRECVHTVGSVKYRPKITKLASTSAGRVLPLVVSLQSTHSHIYHLYYYKNVLEKLLCSQYIPFVM